MYFTRVASAAMAFLSLTAAAPATLEARAISPAQMVTNINAITTLSQQLQPVVAAIQTGGNGIFKRQSNPFQPVIDGFNQIITTAQNDLSSMGNSPPYNDPTAEKQVCTAFHNFVVVHQELLHIVIGKSGLLESLFLGPVAAVLRSLESVVDSLALAIIDSSPVCEATSTVDKENLDTTLGQAVCAYTPGGTLGINLFC